MAEPVAIGNNLQGGGGGGGRGEGVGREYIAVVFLSDSDSQTMDRKSNSALGSSLVFPPHSVQSNVPAPSEAEQYIFISFWVPDRNRFKKLCCMPSAW